jgi:hypothetical protein
MDAGLLQTNQAHSIILSAHATISFKAKDYIGCSNQSNEMVNVCLFVLSRMSKIFSYLATVTITGLRLLAVRVLLRATPTATRDLRF